MFAIIGMDLFAGKIIEVCSFCTHPVCGRCIYSSSVVLATAATQIPAISDACLL